MNNSDWLVIGFIVATLSFLALFMRWAERRQQVLDARKQIRSEKKLDRREKAIDQTILTIRKVADELRRSSKQQHQVQQPILSIDLVEAALVVLAAKTWAIASELQAPRPSAFALLSDRRDAATVLIYSEDKDSRSRVVENLSKHIVEEPELSAALAIQDSERTTRYIIETLAQLAVKDARLSKHLGGLHGIAGCAFIPLAISLAEKDGEGEGHIFLRDLMERFPEKFTIQQLQRVTALPDAHWGAVREAGGVLVEHLGGELLGEWHRDTALKLLRSAQDSTALG